MAQDNRTLEEIKKDHFTELGELLKGRNIYLFPTRKMAGVFFHNAFREALKRLGVPHETIDKIKVIDEILELPDNNIRVEGRRPQGPREAVFWRCGLYFFKVKEDGDHDELAYFMSEIKSRVEGDPPRVVECGILTNIELDNWQPKTHKMVVHLNKPNIHALNRLVI
jgi:hypothetical protein